MEFSNFSSNAFKILKKDIENDMINHAYLLHGANDQILIQTAKDMAKILICKNKGCGECNVCKNIQNNIYSDVLMFPKNSNTFKTEEANFVVSESYVRPLESKLKIFIINNFENATVSAQNKLLKTLEEPPSNVVFILTSQNLFSVLETIRSRSKKIYVLNEDNFDFDQNLKRLAYALFLELKRSSEVLKFSNLVCELENLNQFIEIVQNILLTSLKVNLGVNVNLTDIDKVNINKIAKDFSAKGLHKLYNHLVELEKQIKLNVNKNASIENFLMRILEVRFECQK